MSIYTYTFCDSLNSIFEIVNTSICEELSDQKMISFSEEAKNSTEIIPPKNAWDAWRGNKHTEHAKKKISDSNRKRVYSKETLKKMSDSQMGHSYNKGCKKPESFSNYLKNTKLTCPHCGKTSAVLPYSRWHGDKCKKKIDSATK